jgi:L-alanine-DL-glutamate epimerase-like enolase superfamily enzyme
MRITDIRCYVVERAYDLPPYRWRNGLAGRGDGILGSTTAQVGVLRLDTDEGITGCVVSRRGPETARLGQRRLKRLIGEDPLMTERLWHLVWEIDRIEEMQVHDLGLLDLMAWDVKSRKAGLPLYQLLGGNAARLPVYASTVTYDSMDDYERNIKVCMEEGFTAFKLHAWGDAKEDTKLCRNLRKWTGPDAVLMLDASAGWDYVTSLEVGRALEGEGFLWYEEPMREFELGSYKKLCDALDIPILAAETSDGCHWNAATWIQMGALDMMRTNPSFKGGMTGALKVAHLAEAHGMRAQVHGMGHAQAHLCAAIPNNDYYEQIVADAEHIRSLARRDELRIVEGWLDVPDAPGLGPSPDWARLEREAIAVV